MTIKCPWDKDENGEKVIPSWAADYLLDKDVPASYLKKPSEKTEAQIRSLAETVLGQRNFILLVSQNPSYIWSLYFYLAATWVTTTHRGFYILDIKEFDLEDPKEIVAKLESTSLLIIPYTDPQGWDLRRKRNILGNILAKRKAKNKPVLTDFFLNKMPKKNSELPQVTQPLANIFGEQSLTLFYARESNAKIIKIKEA